MMEIAIYGNPILRKKAEPITEFNEELREFAEEMNETMREADGVGLAAPQVSTSRRMVVIDPTGGEAEPIVFINPEITWFSEDKEDYEEGCLSVPDISLKVNRPIKVTVKALDLEGHEFTIEETGGLLARAIQHEIDHLDGILFVDRVSPLQRQLIAGKLKKLAKSNRV